MVIFTKINRKNQKDLIKFTVVLVGIVALTSIVFSSVKPNPTSTFKTYSATSFAVEFTVSICKHYLSTKVSRHGILKCSRSGFRGLTHSLHQPLLFCENNCSSYHRNRTINVFFLGNYPQSLVEVIIFFFCVAPWVFSQFFSTGRIDERGNEQNLSDDLKIMNLQPVPYSKSMHIFIFSFSPTICEHTARLGQCWAKFLIDLGDIRGTASSFRQTIE